MATPAPARRQQQVGGQERGRYASIQTEVMRQTTPAGTLRLRGEPLPSENRRIRWAEDVVDNEGMGKKSSKVCCIWHRPREVGESSSEDDSSSSSSDSGSDSESDNSRAHMHGKDKDRRKRQRQHHDHDHDESCKSNHGEDRNDESRSTEVQRREVKKRSKNAYEHQPRLRKGGGSTMTEVQK